MVQTRSGRYSHSLPHLPNEVWRDIMLYLPYHDLKTMMRVAKVFASILTDRTFDATLFRANPTEYTGQILGTDSGALEWSLDHFCQVTPETFQLHPLLDSHRQSIFGTDTAKARLNSSASRSATILEKPLLKEHFQQSMQETATWPPAQGIRVKYDARYTFSSCSLTKERFVRIGDVVEEWKKWKATPDLSEEQQHAREFELEARMLRTFETAHGAFSGLIPELRSHLNDHQRLRYFVQHHPVQDSTVVQTLSQG